MADYNRSRKNPVVMLITQFFTKNRTPAEFITSSYYYLLLLKRAIKTASLHPLISGGNSKDLIFLKHDNNSVSFPLLIIKASWCSCLCNHDADEGNDGKMKLLL